MSNSGPSPNKPATSSSAPQKPVHVNAFGVEFDVKDKTDDSPGMSKGAKAALKLGGIGLALAVVVWFQFVREPAIEDADVAASPQVKEVIQSEQKKDTARLVQLAQSQDVVVARRAVTSLGNLGHLDGLTGALADNRADVRVAAVSGMSLNPSAANLPTLTARMQSDPSPDVRIAAMRGVANSKDFSIFDSLIAMLSDPDKNVRHAAINAIEDKLGLRFREYDAKAPSAAAINKIKQTVPKYRDLFDGYNEHMSKRGG